jgi:acyl carrier protein
MNESLASRVREVVAGQFGIALDRLTHATRLRDDLGADRFDRIEMLIAIEEQVAGFAVDDEMIDHIKTIGDLTRAIEGCSGMTASKRRGLGTAPQAVELTHVPDVEAEW